MKNETVRNVVHGALNRNYETKQIMATYFKHVGRLLCHKQDTQYQQLSTQILDLMLAVYQREDYRNTCLSILQHTDALQTLGDCAFLNMPCTLIPPEEKCYFDMKAQQLSLLEVRTLLSFDSDILAMNTRKDGTTGDIHALRLDACLNYLGIGPDTSRERALRLWTMLAYTGDDFAMRALIYGYHACGDKTQAALWQEIFRLYNESNRQFAMPVSGGATQKTASDTVQVILAMRNCLGRRSDTTLPLPMLQYAVESSDALPVKLRNLYAAANIPHVILIPGGSGSDKHYGF